MLRREVEPVDAAALGRFLPAWQNADRPRGDADALTSAVAQLQGMAVPASILESDVPARVRYRPADLDALVAAGDVAWVGAGPLGSDDGPWRSSRGRTRRAPARRAGRAAGRRAPRRDPRAARGARCLVLAGARDRGGDGRRAIAPGGPVGPGVGGRGHERHARAAPRVRAGRVGQDPDAGPGRRPRPGTLRRAGPPAGAGRWSLVAGLRDPAPPAAERLHAIARQLIDRHGVVTREAVLAEGLPGGFVGIYPVFRAMEDAGHVRRGYFVAGLGGAQFAHPGAVDRLRGTASAHRTRTTWRRRWSWPPPTPPSRTARLPGPRARGGRRARPGRTSSSRTARRPPTSSAARGAVTFGTEPGRWADALASLVKDGRLRRIQLGRIDGEDASAPRGRRPASGGVRGRLPRAHAPRMTR